MRSSSANARECPIANKQDYGENHRLCNWRHRLSHCIAPPNGLEMSPGTTPGSWTARPAPRCSKVSLRRSWPGRLHRVVGPPGQSVGGAASFGAGRFGYGLSRPSLTLASRLFPRATVWRQHRSKVAWRPVRAFAEGAEGRQLGHLIARFKLRFDRPEPFDQLVNGPTSHHGHHYAGDHGATGSGSPTASS